MQAENRILTQSHPFSSVIDDSSQAYGLTFCPAGGPENTGSLRDQGRVAGQRLALWVDGCAGRGIHYFPKAFLLRFLASKNEEIKGRNLKVGTAEQNEDEITTYTIGHPPLSPWRVGTLNMAILP